MFLSVLFYDWRVILYPEIFFMLQLLNEKIV